MVCYSSILQTLSNALQMFTVDLVKSWSVMVRFVVKPTCASVAISFVFFVMRCNHRRQQLFTIRPRQQTLSYHYTYITCLYEWM